MIAYNGESKREREEGRGTIKEVRLKYWALLSKKTWERPIEREERERERERERESDGINTHIITYQHFKTKNNVVMATKNKHYRVRGGRVERREFI